MGDLTPWHMYDENCAEIGKERQRQPFQHRDIAAVSEKDLQNN